MSRRRVLDLYTVDGKVRWRWMYASMLAAFLATFCALHEGASPNQSLMATAIAGGLVYTVGLVNYTREPKSKLRGAPSLGSSDLTKPFLWLATAGLVALGVALETPSLAAAVLNRRLQGALQLQRPEKKATEARRVLQIAKQSHAVLRPDLVRKANAEISNYVDPFETSADWEAKVRYVTGQFNQRFARHGTPPEGPDLVMPLDGLISNEVSYGARLTYDGYAKLIIRNSCFGFIELRVANTENGRKLLDAIASSTDGCVNISLEKIP